MKNERREELVEGKRMEKENRRADIAKTGKELTPFVCREISQFPMGQHVIYLKNKMKVME